MMRFRPSKTGIFPPFLESLILLFGKPDNNRFSPGNKLETTGNDSTIRFTSSPLKRHVEVQKLWVKPFF